MNKIIYCGIAVLSLLIGGSCSEEEALAPSDDLELAELFMPEEDADARVKTMYADYGVWVRTHFNSVKELTNSFLATNSIVASRGAVNLEEACVNEVIIYSQTLLSNVSKQFTNAFFPWELYFVKQYGASYWIYQFESLGRSRLIMMWPNQTSGTLPATNSTTGFTLADPENHYYNDEVLTTNVWRYLANMICARMADPITEFVAAGKAYDSGAAYDELMNNYYDGDYTYAEYQALLSELCNSGGYLTANGSRGFREDFADWIRMIATDSYANFYANYLDGNTMRQEKYQVVIDFCNQYGWDIQAAGNKFRQKHDEYIASL
ncbi:MAG: hypothetical protein LBR67_02415 [Dysgonamonadaceae bacterium]|jgi:hypothetical protein|nr:hypothetical protein [Dysgonamonadaceae bacterium]